MGLCWVSCIVHMYRRSLQEAERLPFVPATLMDNKYLLVSAVSVKRLPCSLQLQSVLRMFNSKEPSDYKLIQPWDTPVSVTNVEHEPGWHYSRCHHHVSFPPTYLLVVALTRRHTNLDTHLKATGDLACWTQFELNPLISCQCIFRVATEPPKTFSIATSSTFTFTPDRLTPALDPTHLSQHLLNCWWHK